MEYRAGSFSSDSFTATGGMVAEATPAIFYKRLASLLSDKWDSNHATVIWGACMGTVLFVLLMHHGTQFCTIDV